MIRRSIRSAIVSGRELRQVVETAEDIAGTYMERVFKEATQPGGSADVALTRAIEQGLSEQLIREIMQKSVYEVSTHAVKDAVRAATDAAPEQHKELAKRSAHSLAIFMLNSLTPKRQNTSNNHYNKK